jgi:hypothetical protein
MSLACLLSTQFSDRHVVFLAQRRMLRKPTRHSRVKQQRPRSRTLTVVHEKILEDLVFPSEITGKRTRVSTDGSKLTRVFLDAKDSNLLEYKLDSFASVYRRLTGKDVHLWVLARLACSSGVELSLTPCWSPSPASSLPPPPSSKHLRFQPKRTDVSTGEMFIMSFATTLPASAALGEIRESERSARHQNQPLRALPCAVGHKCCSSRTTGDREKETRNKKRNKNLERIDQVAKVESTRGRRGCCPGGPRAILSFV